MESTVYKKMRLKEGTSGVYLYAPEAYIDMAAEQDFVNFSEKDKYGFVHLFISSKKDYEDRIDEAISKLEDGGALWISYPKSDRKNKYDVNRDILFALTPEKDYIACSSVALDEIWAAMRFKKI
ncbi:hypothetical protein [Clostridium manihotivorum]|uniref:DUF3052 domain-containing protein n=1 Tax=Clostridium manihotivorum TaxID=2320868 RepID=A0A410DXW0_9CLOT|nr:hypothetical protein [Clostridium manihotivorum]QAA33840.1 hypothetical protein C1I91_20615 [Clostridium manihotivorum]